MVERTNRQELMIETAAQMFITQGYKATSMRQIADTVGCTEAALYHYFKGGKQELFQTILERCLPEFLQTLDACRGAQSLGELLTLLSKGLEATQDRNWPRFSWLFREFPNLSLEQQALIRQEYLVFHRELARLLEPFMPDKSAAAALAWTLICANQGYLLLFGHLGLAGQVEFPPKKFHQQLAQQIMG